MNGRRLYVGNLFYSVTSEELRELFSRYGTVRHANIVEGKRFGFVEMFSPKEVREPEKP